MATWLAETCGNSLYIHNNLLTYLFTPYNTVLLEGLTTFQLGKKFYAFCGTRRFITAVPSPRQRGLLFDCFATYVFYGEELLALRPNPKLEDHSLSAVRDCLFNISPATLHIPGRSSIHNLMTRHVVVTGTQLSQK